MRERVTGCGIIFFPVKRQRPVPSLKVCTKTLFYVNSRAAFCVSLGANPQYIPAMQQVIQQLRAAHVAHEEILALQRTEFDPGKAEHSAVLEKLWGFLSERKPLPLTPGSTCMAPAPLQIFLCSPMDGYWIPVSTTVA